VQLRLNFEFTDGTNRPPVAQSHILHPPAPAFFHFPCGFGDCDGGFDLGAAIEEMSGASTRKSVRQFECAGVRVRDRATGKVCGLKLECTIEMQFNRDKAA
jgi:hypothetical protein